MRAPCSCARLCVRFDRLDLERNLGRLASQRGAEEARDDPVASNDLAVLPFELDDIADERNLL